MLKYFNKNLILNYLLSFIVFIILITFIHKFFIYTYKIDLTKSSHIKTIIDFIFTGKIFKTQKNIAFLLSLVGICILSFSSIILSMDKKLKKEETKIEVTENSNKNEEINEETKTEENKNETTNTEIKDKQETIVKPKFAMYDKTNAINSDNNQLFETKNSYEEDKKEDLIDEDKEKQRLQSKIQELMNKIEKNNSKSRNIENSDNIEENINNLSTEKEDKNKISDNENILSRMKFKKSNKTTNETIPDNENNNLKETIDMNYNTISKEQNLIMEQCLVNTGAKLLSEIRIGNNGGIDYLLVSKNKIDVIQMDTSTGNWVAGEDILEGEKPLWLSDTGNKISPIYRAITGADLIKNLLKDKKINFEVNPVVCIANSSIINLEEEKNKWEEQNITITKLTSNSSIDELPLIEEIFKINSLEEPNKKTLDNIIKILEEAELPA